jgi:hypothetical protein
LIRDGLGILIAVAASVVLEEVVQERPGLETLN